MSPKVNDHVTFTTAFIIEMTFFHLIVAALGISVVQE